MLHFLLEEYVASPRHKPRLESFAQAVATERREDTVAWSRIDVARLSRMEVRPGSKDGGKGDP